MTTTRPSAVGADRGSVRSWAGYAGFAWSLAYLTFMHLPILLTGRPLLPYPEDPTGGLSDVQLRISEAGVCLLLLGTALTSLALVRPWGRLFPRWMLLGVAWVGGVIGLLHWAIWTWQSLSRMTGAVVVPVPDGVSEQVWTAFVREYDLLNVFLYEPWFLGMGLFLCVGAVQNSRAHRGLDVATAQLPAWLTWRGWPGYVLVGWAVLGAVAQLSWAAGGTFGQTLGLPVPDGHASLLAMFRPGFLVLGVLTAVAPLVRRGHVAARVLAGVFLLGGLVIVLVGIMQFDPWVFACYGPALMAGGILLELSGRRQRSYSGA